jgi:hypothetical protein
MKRGSLLLNIGILDYNFEKNCSQFAINLPVHLRYHLLQGLQAG